MPDSHPATSPDAVGLRPVDPADLPTLFELQLDPESNRMAGTKPWSAEAFQALWERILQDPTVIPRVVLHGGLVVGSLSCFKRDGADEIGYWIDRKWWGRGIASRALQLFVREVAARPLHATAARNNLASIRVLERAGFRLIGHHTGEETDRYVACELALFVLE